jgi:hypothetical protein
MIHKLTALMLALLIASPVCWCGWMHVTASQAEVPSCCQHKHDAADTSAPLAPEDCPCSKAPKARETTVAKVLVPAPVMSEGTLPPQHPATTFSTVWQPASSVFWRDAHSPPRPAVPLRVLHCSWLV